MNRNMKKLWRELGATGEPPMPEVAEVKRRVNAALNEDPSERRLYMKQKVRVALAVAAAVLAFSGAAVAVAAHLDVLEAFFEGDTSPAEGLMDTKPRTVSDENYTLTVTSSVSDETETYLILQVEAKNEQARATLMGDSFVNMDTFHIVPIKDGEYAKAVKQGNGETMGVSFSVGEEGELRTENTRLWGFAVTRPGPTDTLRVWLDVMGKEHTIEVPVIPAESLSVNIGAEGKGAPTLDNAEGGTLRVESVTLSPFTCQVEIARRQGEPEGEPLLLFRMEDGSLRSQSQMMKQTSGHNISDDDDTTTRFLWRYRFHSVQDLSKIRGLVVFGREYPLDGGASHAVADGGDLQPFRLPLGETLDEEVGGYSMHVRALCQGLGGDCQWDNETRAVTCSYRGVTIVLRPGSKTALVDGKPVEMPVAPVIRDGTLLADYDVFCDAWKVDAFAALNETRDDRVCWIVTP